MAFTWTSKSAVKGEPISAASVNEVRNLLNTMYSQVNCSTRNAIVYSSDNSGYDSSKDSIIEACTTVYSSRNSSYCTEVNASQTTTSYLGNSIECTENHGSQYVSHTCDAHNAEKWSADNGYKHSTYYNDTYTSDNSSLCHKEYGTCTSNYGDNNSSHCTTKAGCTRANSYTRAANDSGNWTTHNNSKYSADRYSNCPWDDDSQYTGDCSQNDCSAQNSSRYGSKAFCPSYNNAKYEGKNSAHREPYNAKVRVCNTVHDANG